MGKNDLHSDAAKALVDADATIRRSGMSVKKRKLALDILKANTELRKMRMVNTKPRKIRKPR